MKKTDTTGLDQRVSFTIKVNDWKEMGKGSIEYSASLSSNVEPKETTEAAFERVAGQVIKQIRARRKAYKPVLDK